MKKIIRSTKGFLLALLTITYSCNNDDTVMINLENLTVTIDENPTAGQAIGTIQSNSNSSLAFTISSQTPSGALAINESTGELTVADASLFDFETNPTITATVDADEAQNTATVTITINNVNELSVQDFSSTIVENPTNGQTLGTVQASGDAIVNYSISSQTPAGALSINTNTGELTVADATLFDFETNPTITATVSVDNAGNVQIATATILLTDAHEIGEFKFGGVIFWVNATGNEGYVIATIDQSSGTTWGCANISISGATGTAIGTGATNTAAIEAACSTTGTAADLAANLSLNGHNDWFLPSKDEMYEVYVNRNIINTACIANGGSSMVDDYWTSTEYNTSNAWFQVFSTSGQHATGKFGSNPNVRAIRHWTDF